MSRGASESIDAGPASEGAVAAARDLAPRIAAAADATEAARRLPADLVAAIAERGLYRLLVPRALGGGETHPAVMVDAFAEIARADGAAGWCTMIGATSGVMSAYLPESAARRIYGDPGTISGGVFHPRGRAIAEGDGFVVSGRWPFASGCESCTWLMGGCIVFEPGGERPRQRSTGAPEARLALFPAGQAQIVDTWSVAGLRGTGSHDIAVRELRVPAEHTAWLADPPARQAPLYAFPVFGLLALGIAGVAIGIARGAIDDLVALATEKVPTGGRRTLAERNAIQSDVARAEGLVRGARAFLHDAIGSAWRAAEAGATFDLRQRALLRVAATDAVRAAARAVDLMYEAGGGTSIYETSRLQRRFRDVHVATQHALVAPPTYELAGRVLLGLETDAELL